MPWIEAISIDDVEEEDVIKWDHGDRTFAIIRSPDGDFFCTDGLCTHEHVHLADGLVMDFEIECPRHNGIFDYRSGEALRAPACDHLQVFETKVDAGKVFVLVASE